MTLIIVFGPVSQADLLLYICLEEGPKNSANVLYNAMYNYRTVALSIVKNVIGLLLVNLERKYVINFKHKYLCHVRLFSNY